MLNPFSEILIGIITGFISSVFGLGGGIIIVPALNIYLGINQHEAVATSLFSIGLITLFNTLRFYSQKQLQWKFVLQLSALGVVSAFMAGKLALYFSAWLLSVFFVLVLIFLLWRLHLSSEIQNELEAHLPAGGKVAMMGVFAGFVSGFCGVGGGSILGPLLMNCKRIRNSDIVPVVNVFMMLSAFSASVAFATANLDGTESMRLGAVHLDSSAFIFLGAIPAAILGTKFQSKVSFALRKRFLFIFLSLILLRMLLHLLV